MDVNAVNNYGCSALWQAANFRSHWKVFETLLKAGANPNQLNDIKESVVTRYLKDSSHYDSNVVRLLLEYGFDTNLLSDKERARLSTELATHSLATEVLAVVTSAQTL